MCKITFFQFLPSLRPLLSATINSDCTFLLFLLSALSLQSLAISTLSFCCTISFSYNLVVSYKYPIPFISTIPSFTTISSVSSIYYLFFLYHLFCLFAYNSSISVLSLPILRSLFSFSTIHFCHQLVFFLLHLLQFFSESSPLFLLTLPFRRALTFLLFQQSPS